MLTSNNTFLQSCNGYPFVGATDANVSSTASTLSILGNTPQYQQPAVYAMIVEPAFASQLTYVSLQAAPPTTIAVASPQALVGQVGQGQQLAQTGAVLANAAAAGSVFPGCQSAVSQFIPTGANAWQGLIANYNRPYSQLRQGYGGGQAW